MNSVAIASKSLSLLKLLLQVNFNASVIFLLIVSVISMTGSDYFFTDNSDLYGPLANNLRFVLFYLCMIEIGVYSFCRFVDNYQGIALLGVFILLLIASLEVYSVINQVPVDDNYARLFLYSGLSHLGFGGFYLLTKKES
jgi:hypothetical protein